MQLIIPKRAPVGGFKYEAPFQMLDFLVEVLVYEGILLTFARVGIRCDSMPLYCEAWGKI